VLIAAILVFIVMASSQTTHPGLPGMFKMSSRPPDAPRTSLGPRYHKLWTATAISTLGDGVFATALPLLAATLSRDPLQVSLITFSGWLPWLLFGLVAGALVDRLDRRRLMWTVDAARSMIVAALGMAVLAGWASVPLLAVGGFMLGIGATLFDNAATSLLPSLVGRDARRLDRANSQLYGTETAGQRFLGPPFWAGCCSPWAPSSHSWGTRSRSRPARR
jgi:MFS family permease